MNSINKFIVYFIIGVLAFIVINSCKTKNKVSLISIPFNSIKEIEFDGISIIDSTTINGIFQILEKAYVPETKIEKRIFLETKKLRIISFIPKNNKTLLLDSENGFIKILAMNIVPIYKVDDVAKLNYLLNKN